MSENNLNSTSSDILETDIKATENLLPEKSKDLYKSCYDQFVAWQSEKKMNSFSEKTLLVYFEELSNKFKPSSVWSKYSMLKSTIFNTHYVDISKYKQLTAFLYENSKGFESKKSKTLEPAHIEKFLREAPDDQYLAVKVALILGVTGACTREELKKISMKDIKHSDDMVLITIPETKNNVKRTFVVDGELYEIFKQYEALRPPNCVFDQFFLCYRNGKCTQQVSGINTLGNMPRTVAQYLKLDEPEKYTGNSFRRTSETILADSGADRLTLKRHGGCKSNKVAIGYVDDSVSSKKKICQQISTSINLKQSDVSTSETTDHEPRKNNEDNTNAITITSNVSHNNNQENETGLLNIFGDRRFLVHLNNCQVTFNIMKP